MRFLAALKKWRGVRISWVDGGWAVGIAESQAAKMIVAVSVRRIYVVVRGLFMHV